MSAAIPEPTGPAPQGGQPGTGEESVAKLISIAPRPTLAQRLISWASRPPGKLYLPSCVIVALVLLYEDSVPGGHLTSFVLGLGGGAVLATMGALRLGIAMTVARPMIRYYWLRWITPPLIALAAVALSLADVPLQARVDASAADLLHLRETTGSSGVVLPEERWTGFYPISEVSEREGVTLFTVEGAGLLKKSGLAYSPKALETDVFLPGHGNVVYEHVKGNWYSWTDY
ncbi:hypothetical protein [Thermobifida cellulosilytica]|uniref:Uncharacterized protein n=1 Tax=Thermobifida cellulosilytica TB100 TaxID=665004 RepID=A0A147KHH9_THECS|nr:hypothetical protein [Thermobifida cellulosilytica]KUP96752.1 hypothetical protein AC529_10500 [Thermobifida cellulosilytica TB100]